MQMDPEYTSTFSTNGPFVPPSNWMYSSTAEMQAWNTPGIKFQDTAVPIGAPEIQNYPSGHPFSPSSNSMSSRYTSLSSGQSEPFILGEGHPATNCVPGSSYSVDTYGSVYSYPSPVGPNYAAVINSSPEPLESDIQFGFDDGPCYDDMVQADLAHSSPATSGNGEQTAGARRTREERPCRTRAKKSTARSCRASASGGEASPIVCPSCQKKYSCSSSLQRHRNESCEGDGGPKRLFYCDSRFHPGCKKGFKRRDNLKEHYRKLAFSEEEAGAMVREQYGKGMHCRRRF